MMEIVIKIPDKIYKFVQNTSFVENESTLFKQTSTERQKTLFLFDILDAIKNGTPLPEHCGRLIDANSLIKAIEEKAKRLSNVDTINGLCGAVALIFDEPTIIEGSEE